jgi:ferredoxin-type protein NapF
MTNARPMTRRVFLVGRQFEPTRSDAGGSVLIRISDGCLPRAGISCMACRDVCEPGAIRFRPRAGGPFLPEIDAGACTGCGSCVSVCPADAIELAGARSEAADA